MVVEGGGGSSETLPTPESTGQLTEDVRRAGRVGEEVPLYGRCEARDLLSHIIVLVGMRVQRVIRTAGIVVFLLNS